MDKSEECLTDSVSKYLIIISVIFSQTFFMFKKLILLLMQMLVYKRETQRMHL